MFDSRNVTVRYSDRSRPRVTTVNRLKLQFKNSRPEWYKWFFDQLRDRGKVETPVATYVLGPVGSA